jgi:NADP-dependent 3-hydroxy acid dehydrogenase YdfG
MQASHHLQIELLALDSDVTDDTAVQAFISTIITSEGHIDIVVNNAGSLG